MKIRDLIIYPVRIPFSFSVDHHLKNRTSSSSLVVAISTYEGKVGYGEGAPREYVTGESLVEVEEAMDNARSFCTNQIVNTLEDIDALSQELLTKYAMPSMVAAIETALLDLLGQVENCSIADFFTTQKTYPLVYSGVLPHLPKEKLMHWLGVVQKLELQHIKMKVGYVDDLENLTLARQILGWQVDIRVDANRAWTLEEAILKIKELEQFQISCIEEPLVAEEIENLPALSRKISTPLLLDESVYNLKQAAYFAEKIDARQLIFNLKISKSGGLRGASHLHKFAKKHGIDCQLGCNVGETAILSSAGRIFAQTHELKYLEGSFAPFFMEADIGTEPIAFAKKGIAKRLNGNGLGITIDLKQLEKYSHENTNVLVE